LVLRFKVGLLLSLRLRLFVSIAGVLALTLIVGCVLIYLDAVKKVDTEVAAALSVGIRTVQNATDDADEAANPLRQLELLVGDFDGNRHVQAFLMNPQGLPIARSMLLIPSDPSPGWFNHLLARDPQIVHLDLPTPFARYGSILLSTDSHNEIDEAWSDFQVTLVILTLFCALVLVLVYITLGRPLALLQKMTAAFRTIGRGDYSPRMEERGAPEIVDLSHCFNDMVARLANTEQQNVKLQQQLTNVQEEERADLARDLHDEIGPLLFALSIDVATLQRRSAEGRKQIGADFEVIASAISEIQLHVRSMLGKLRPAVLLDLGLDQAVDNLVGFWSKRREDVRISFDLDCDSFGETLDSTIYRVFREGLNNALRHGKPSAVELKAKIDGENRVKVIVSDDGEGLPAGGGHFGYGLVGMRERVEDLGGTLSISNRSDGKGVAVVATLPLDVVESNVSEPVA
jgi:two-component system, NarL family, sensor histidine kinase UhpB